MAKKLFVVEIDPRNESIKKVEFDNSVVELRDLYAHLECDLVEKVSLVGDIDLWVDEEGGLNNAFNRIGSFNIGEYQFVGKGLVCAFTPDGDSVPLDEDFADYLVEHINIQF
tara:strand:+ start:1043 stop:1378 length:336 start_codon:yes stop_codon:yes gene_type:complete